MYYEVADDNRIIIMDYFMEQDTEGNIYVYRESTRKHIVCFPYDKVLSKSEFRKLCFRYYTMNTEREGTAYAYWTR